jgi:hypothetical protein
MHVYTLRLTMGRVLVSLSLITAVGLGSQSTGPSSHNPTNEPTPETGKEKAKIDGDRHAHEAPHTQARPFVSLINFVLIWLSRSFTNIADCRIESTKQPTPLNEPTPSVRLGQNLQRPPLQRRE